MITYYKQFKDGRWVIFSKVKIKRWCKPTETTFCHNFVADTPSEEEADKLLKFLYGLGC